MMHPYHILILNFMCLIWQFFVADTITAMIEVVQKSSDLLPEESTARLRPLSPPLDRSRVNVHSPKMSSVIVVMENEELEGTGRRLILEADRVYGVKVFRAGPNDTDMWMSALGIDDAPFDMYKVARGRAAVVIQRAASPEKIVNTG